MPNTLRGLARWSGVVSLWVLIAPLLVLSALLHALNDPLMIWIAALQDKADELRNAD
jgi:hypothetical protein